MGALRSRTLLGLFLALVMTAAACAQTADQENEAVVTDDAPEVDAELDDTDATLDEDSNVGADPDDEDPGESADPDSVPPPEEEQPEPTPTATVTPQPDPGTPISVTEQYCLDQTNTDCTFAGDVVVSGRDARFEVRVSWTRPPDSSPDDTLVLSLFTFDGPVGIECDSNGQCVGFYGAGLAGYEADFPVTVREEEGLIVFEDVPLTVSDGIVQLNLPDGGTSGAMAVPAGPRTLDSAVIYVDDSATDLSIDDLLVAIEPAP